MAEERYVLKEPLAPYRQIESEMLEKKQFDQLPPEPMGKTQADLVGRYGLVELGASAPLTKSELGPMLERESLSQMSVVAVSPMNDAILDAIERGTKVTLALSPSDVKTDPLLISAAIVLDWKRTADDKSVEMIVAIPTLQIQKFAQYIGSSTVVVIR